MPPLLLLFILFMVSVIAGAIRAGRLVVASRKAGQRLASLQQWSEKPLPSWKYEPYATIAILIHTLAVLVLSFAALRAASNPGILSSSFFTNDITMIGLVWFSQCGCISIVGYQLGPVLVALPLIVFRKEPVAVAITEKGMALGQYLLPWHWFSRFSVDSGESILRLYSAFSPDLPSLTLKQPESIPLMELEETLRGFLPLHFSEGRRAWYRTRFLLIPTMLMACLIVVGLGWLSARLPRELALFLIALLTVLLVFVGGLILNVFAFGVFMARSNSARQPPAA